MEAGGRRTDPALAMRDDAARLLEGGGDLRPADLAAGLAALAPEQLLRFDALARSWHSGFPPREIARLRRPRRGRRELWEVLSLVSADGRERERGVRAAPLGALTVRMLVIRATDWVPQVRDAAIERLEESTAAQLLDALPLADHLAAGRLRGDALERLLDRLLVPETLRAAARSSDHRVRRAAWRRLLERDAATAGDVERGLEDPDIVVRRRAVSAIRPLAPGEQRRLAGAAIDDPAGTVAAPALGILVALDGSGPIERALMGRSAGVRRAARDWAALRGLDARGAYLTHLRSEPRDPTALLALAELADDRDRARFHAMIDDDRRRVRAAGLRALSRADHPAARALAVMVLRAGATGRLLWAATDVLRSRSPSPEEIDALLPIARDPGRPPAQRLRALGILRPSRWLHLATVLEDRAAAGDGPFAGALDHEVDVWLSRSNRIGRAPEPALAAQLARLLPTLDPARRDRIAFILRTSL